MSEKEIYIVITQTGTILSRVLKRLTGAEYNHASVSLESDLHCMYSFGRKNPYNPWWGGFVKEGAEFGTFKRFSETRAVVLAVSIDERTYEEIDHKLRDMLENKSNYHYDSLGLMLAAFKIIYKREKYFYCSDFVKELLVSFGIEDRSLFEPIVQPMHFLNLPGTREIYRGRLRDFSVKRLQNQG